LLAEFIQRIGARHAFGVGGANIEDMFLAVQRRRPELRAVLCKHEHGAGTAADAYARLRGFAVVMVTSGGGAMNLVHAVAEARASRVPVLALVGEPPTDQQGRGGFQDTSGRAGSVDALAVFRALTPECTRLTRPDQVLHWLEQQCMTPPRQWTGPRVLLLAKDLQQAEVAVPADFLPRLLERTARAPGPAADAEALATALGARPVAIVAGPEVARAGAQAELQRLAALLGACISVTPDARDACDNELPSFSGVVGAMGHPAAARALLEARTILLVGTRLPLLARLGLERCLSSKQVLSLGSERPFVPCRAELVDASNLACELAALNDELEAQPPGSATLPLPSAATEPEPAPGALMPAALALLARHAPAGSTLVVDAGNTGASAVHQLRAPHGGRWLLAQGMAGMGYSFGAALGAALATGGRVLAVAGDGAFFMHGLELHTAVEHQLPITFVVLDNAAHGMCLVREQLLLGQSSGYNAFRRSRLAAGASAMFPGLLAFECDDLAQLEAALEQAGSATGPCFISLRLPRVEIPPFAAFHGARAAGLSSVARGDEP
jgi:acetolactate synthase-1/2/3 large subunit